MKCPQMVEQDNESPPEDLEENVLVSQQDSCLRENLTDKDDAKESLPGLEKCIPVVQQVIELPDSVHSGTHEHDTNKSNEEVEACESVAQHEQGETKQTDNVMHSEAIEDESTEVNETRDLMPHGYEKQSKLQTDTLMSGDLKSEDKNGGLMVSRKSTRSTRRTETSRTRVKIHGSFSKVGWWCGI